MSFPSPDRFEQSAFMMLLRWEIAVICGSVAVAGVLSRQSRLAMGQVDAHVASQCDAGDERAPSAGAIQNSQLRSIFWRALNRSTHVFEQSGVRQE
jgi:hypothetical protein